MIKGPALAACLPVGRVGKAGGIFKITLTSLIATFACVGIIYAATTIGTNITTTGSLNVTATTTIDTDTFFVDATNNRVGIGTTTPQYKLDVNGDVNISNSNSFKINGETILFASTTRNNIFVGDNSGSSSVSGGGNSFLGYQSGLNTISGQLNTFIGESAGNNNNSGSYNDFFGSSAGLYNTTGSSNTFIGTTAGYSNITGSSNTFIGGAVGFQHTSGDYNTFIGNGAGYNNYSGSGNVFLGYRAGYNASSTNRLYITNSDTVASSSLIYGEFNNNILSFNAKVGIGTSTPSTKLEIHDTATSTISVISETASKGGRIILEDSDGAGCSEIYILDGVISSATVACPAN